MVFPFKSQSSLMIVGPSNCGKTYFTSRLLKHKDVMFTENICNVLYCYSVWQVAFDKMSQDVENIQFHQGIPDDALIKRFTEDKLHNLVILDDLMVEFLQDKTAYKLFTMGCHHLNLSLIFITHNMFQQGPHSRTISLNANYFILFRNIRDCMQVRSLNRQIFPGKNSTLIDAYQDATSKPHGYIIIDFTPNTDDVFRLRTDIFPGELTISYKNL